MSFSQLQVHSNNMSRFVNKSNSFNLSVIQEDLKMTTLIFLEENCTRLAIKKICFSCLHCQCYYLGYLSWTILLQNWEILLKFLVIYITFWVIHFTVFLMATIYMYTEGVFFFLSKCYKPENSGKAFIATTRKRNLFYMDNTSI